ncbi:MAG: hypothetical protein ABJV04_14755 [Aliiglaciecola sp.]|uniref:hypothetical protein n=1 Tax=Aliiglaciecola sp. TaxID=1872441 RepID=UPI003298C838
MRINMLFIMALSSIGACSPEVSEPEHSKNSEQLLEEQQKHDNAKELKAEKQLLEESQTEIQQALITLEQEAELHRQQSEQDLLSLAAEKDRLVEQQLIEMAEQEAKELEALLQEDEQAIEDNF